MPLVESRFSTYSQLNLEPDISAEFRSLLIWRTAATLPGIRSLAGLVETEDEKLRKLSPREYRKALEAALRREPTNVVWPLSLAREAAEHVRLVPASLMARSGVVAAQEKLTAERQRGGRERTGARVQALQHSSGGSLRP